MKGRNRTQKAVSVPDEKVKSASGTARIGEILAKFGRRVELAARIGVSESRISEYIAGKRVPTPEAWIKLGKLALEHGLADPFFFWAQAGVDAQTLEAMASRIAEGRYPLMGDTVPIPRFRETSEGRQDAGPPVPLPVRFVPNPSATICLDVDEKSSGVVSAPRGLFVLDTSVLGTANVLAHQERVVMVYIPQLPGSYYPKGLYAGRVRLQQRQHGSRPDWGWLGVFLLPLPERSRWASLGPASYETPLREDWGHESFEIGSYEEIDVMRGVAWENDEERSGRFADMWQRVGSNFPLTEGVRIVGRVIGRLTGHLER